MFVPQCLYVHECCIMFSSAHQIFGDEEKHDVVRKQVVDYMLKNKEHFSPYITEDFDRYICRKKDPTCYGNHVEIQAMAELYNRPVEIYHDSVEPINVFHADYSKEFPIRLSYHGHVHYNSVVDPFKPAFGYGLGMPNYQPSVSTYSYKTITLNSQLAEPDLISQAIKESETTQLEEAMLRDKLAETEQSEIDRCIQAQAARESYYEYLSQLNLPVSTASCSSSGLPARALASAVRPPAYPRWTSQNVASSSSSALAPPVRFDDASSLPMPVYHQGQHLPTELRGIDEDTLVAMVMEQSRQEYLESLRRERTSPLPSHEADVSPRPNVTTTDSNSVNLATGRSSSPMNSGTKVPPSRHSE
ncbi:OTU domain-containing protein 5-A [Fasciola gigantica]|uniref:ubiquitinyl hydrolase 1 n=1 Tax=Fasciola gigantica TaxID=46835 RepID=A0A504YQC8_FASGI|nr:OTU domain-containing protein 5-A [Fasciola gigantica]